MKFIRNRSLLFWMNMGVFGLLMIISISHGFQYKFAGESKALYFNVMAAPYFLILILLTVACFSAWYPTNTTDSLSLTGLTMMSLSFFMTSYFYSHKLPNVPLVSMTIPVIAVTMLLHKKGGATASTMTFLLLGTVLYGLFVINVPHTDGANMLELIEVVGEAFFGGSNPYSQHYGSTVDNKFAYLPALWIPYSVAYEVGADMRIINFFCLGAIIFLFQWALDDCPKKSQITSVTLYPIVLAPPVAQMIIHGHVLPYWLYLSVTAIALHKNRVLMASVAFGFALAARQPSIFLIPLFAAYIYQKVRFQEFLKLAAITLLSYAVIVLPFAIWTGSEFWSQTYLAVSAMEYKDFLLHQINGSGFLYSMDLQNILKYIQVLFVLGGMAAVMRNDQKSHVWFIYFSGLIYIWVVFFNVYVARYIYIPAIMLMSFSVAIAMSGKGNDDGLAAFRSDEGSKQ